MSGDRKIWAEDFAGSRLSGEDMLTDLSIDEMDHVKSTAVKAGMLLMFNCVHCGRQTKEIVKWAEIACWVLGRPIQSCEGKKDGMHHYWACRCGRQNEMVHKWAEVKQYVDEGVGSGMLKPEIYKAAGIV